MDKKKQALKNSRASAHNAFFKCRNRKADKDFSRQRSLPFAQVLTMILRKSVKPLQSMVNEAMQAAGVKSVPASAYTQARHKLRHTAFIELNQTAVVEVMYADGVYKRFWGYRVLGVDGSRIRLPTTEELVFDRNYASYELLAELTQQQRAFATARAMLNLPKTLRVRFVRVRLDTGEWKVLVTSLLDEQLYPTATFKALYHLRWGIETFYGILKTRLELENFSGISVESVKQDFYATLYLTGLESILTADEQDSLNQRLTQHPQTVNRGVAFNILTSSPP
ncbi:transposase [Thiothrix litoralis]|uniref:Transposase n=1 Tax=Thiothrix litoralis TaxID=2891210 RepID=A0ABX7WU77_9GAMM|nr:transposase [Thiothrix litoralis]QTR47230.1 transposase [Thiothrix litoralis]